MKKKILIAVLCVVMMAIGGLAVWAYFTDQDEAVNTFTVGDLDIVLDEEAVNPDGTATEEDDARVQENDYHLIPGHAYLKDPTIHVTADSEDCWLFVTVQNDIAKIECDDDDYDTVADQMAANGWLPLGKTYEGKAVYYYKNIVAKSENVQDFVVFDGFKIDGDNAVNQEEAGENWIGNYDGLNIIVNAFAVQADGFEDSVTDAWDATFGK